MKVIQFVGWCCDNGTWYKSYTVFDKYLIHIGGRFPWIHGSLGVPF